MMMNLFKRHPVWSGVVATLVFLIWSFPQWFGSIWPLFTDKTLPQWLAGKTWGVSVTATAWLAFLIGLLLGFVILAILYYAKKLPSAVEPPETATLFENRDQLNSTSGGLQRELSRVRNGWIMWPVGGSSVSLPNEALANIQRLILRNPNKNGNWYARHFISGSSQILSSTIADLTIRAKRAGVSVRWNADFDLSVIISDHINDGAWARIELLLPEIESAFRPNLLIRKNDYPQLFETLVKMYEYIWNGSTDAVDPVEHNALPQ